ncbi:ABC transporter ATP-binding protein [Effusibacillus pohliae]|uniref:ABC transporter ATP-binding protein n=1 Tax=Effusibacillus pohliae TaxID=232270 RepID=UPI00036BA343|nr:ABC transporter ATP-binding protein [Effusibacillus pohliae]
MQMLSVNIVRAGYPDRRDLLQNIRFSVGSGELVGLIGPNGAGKSTTIRAILGLLKEMDGTVSFTGPNRSYAYIPERPVLYERLTLWEHLELVAAAHEMESSDFAEKAEQLLGRFRLQDVRHHFPASFSKGMQQKIMLIIGFLLQPDVYIVDEPFIGLDPRATKEFLQLLDEERKRGAAVLMSTHVLDTAERICDAFLLLADGRVVAQGNLEQIRERCGMSGGSLFDCFDRLLEGAEC